MQSGCVQKGQRRVGSDRKGNIMKLKSNRIVCLIGINEDLPSFYSRASTKDGTSGRKHWHENQLVVANPGIVFELADVDRF